MPILGARLLGIAICSELWRIWVAVFKSRIFQRQHSHPVTIIVQNEMELPCHGSVDIMFEDDGSVDITFEDAGL